MQQRHSPRQNLTELKPSALNGDVDAMEQYAAYWEKQNDTSDREMLFAWYFECASIPVPETPEDDKLKREKLKKAAFDKLIEKKSAYPDIVQASDYAGRCYENGYGTEVNIEKASAAYLEYARQAIKNNKEHQKKAYKRLTDLAESLPSTHVGIRAVYLSLGLYHKETGEFREACTYFKKAEAALSDLALLELARAYQEGEGVEKNINMAAIYLHRWIVGHQKDTPHAELTEAAVQTLKYLANICHSPHANYFLSLDIYSQYNIDRPTQKNHLQKAANKGHLEARFQLADLYIASQDIKLYRKATKYYYQITRHAQDANLSGKAIQKLIDLMCKGSVRAAIYLSNCHEFGFGGVPQNPQQAHDILANFIKKNSENEEQETSLLSTLQQLAKKKKLQYKAYYCFGIYYEKSDSEKACAHYYEVIKELSLQCEQTTVRPLRQMAMQRLKTLEGNQDNKGASAYAHNILGKCYQYGFGGVPVNIKESKSHFLEAIKMGNLAAHENIAGLYLAIQTRQGKPRPNRKEAAIHYNQLLLQTTKRVHAAISALEELAKSPDNDNDADYFLGCYYEREKQYKKAAKHYLKIRKRNKEAKKNLALLYQCGAEEFPANPKKAAKYFFQLAHKDPLTHKDSQYLENLCRLAETDIDAKLYLFLFLCDQRNTRHRDNLDTHQIKAYTETILAEGSAKQILEMARAYKQNDPDEAALCYYLAATREPTDSKLRKTIKSEFTHLASDNITAALSLADCLENGTCMDANPAEAIVWYEGIKDKSPQANLNLGLHYLRGEYVPQDLNQAAQLFFDCICQCKNNEEKKDLYQTAIEFLKDELAKKHRVPNAFAYLALLQEMGYDLLEKEKEEEEPSALIFCLPQELNRDDSNKDSNPHTDEKSFTYVNLTLFSFNRKYQNISYVDLAKIYGSDVILVKEGDREIEKSNNFIQAAEYYFNAAKSNSSASIGSPLAFAKLLELAKKEDADPIIMHFVGECYLNGYGVNKDFNQAKEYFRKASQHPTSHIKNKSTECIGIIEQIESENFLLAKIEVMRALEEHMKNTFKRFFSKVYNCLTSSNLSLSEKLIKLHRLIDEQTQQPQQFQQTQPSFTRIIGRIGFLPVQQEQDPDVVAFCKAIKDGSETDLQVIIENLQAKSTAKISPKALLFSLNGDNTSKG